MRNKKKAVAGEKTEKKVPHTTDGMRNPQKNYL